jgi:hypothetical protein
MPADAYDVHPGVAQMQVWIEELPEKTGRSLGQWMSAIRRERFKDEKAARAWLKAEHGVGTNTAWWLVERAFAKDLSLMDDDPERYLALAPKYVAGQYAGKRAALRPIFDRLVALARSLGGDIRVCPCKTIVPVYRGHVIAQIKPATNTRVDFGLALGGLVKKGTKVPARLIDTGGYAKKDRITHRIGLESPDEVDEFVGSWAGRAYRLADPAD